MTRIFTLFLITFIFISCKKENEEPVDPQIAAMAEDAISVLNPLVRNPPDWTDPELRFLDQYADKSVIGLGEATHGTSDFFSAKHRILRYMAENHDFRIFAIEADFGESVYLNEAIQQSQTASLRQLMREKMHFWTWQTEEVLDLLEWMSEYNRSRADDEKLQYIGVDCQLNTFNPSLVREYLVTSGASFNSFAETVLAEAETANEYTLAEFDLYNSKLTALQDSFLLHREQLVNASSENAFEFNLRALTVVRQTAEVSFRNRSGDYSKNFRDEFMAENTAWISEYFEGAKTILWAHNYHVSKASTNGFRTQGDYLKEMMQANYASIGFMFNRGQFNAISQVNGQNTGLKMFMITSEAKDRSFNYIFSHIENSVFSVAVSDLKQFESWNSSIASLEYIQIGAVYNGKIDDYYYPFDADHFDQLIYFDNTIASHFLW